MTAEEEDHSLAMKLAISGISVKFPSVKNISTAILHSWLGRQKSINNFNMQDGPETHPVGQLIVLDARPNHEYCVSHIPEAVRVDHEVKAEEILRNVPQLNTDTKATVVCYCSVGYRSSLVADKLDKYFQQQAAEQKTEKNVHVYNLEGSLFKWANEGRPMMDCNDQATKYAHPYNSVFGKLLKKEIRKGKL
ncbi:hypothetical protein CHS0354_030416 [Potamilus streckersoni]|uniref:Rhodanese domain-containing protein n=1 Tax=Potamilus streckersoni TaxID=2493646 RepID=A0AAE0S8K6_9BIVA|nr:hypothetical protein CHS0354_030416 [Potamilus streckersoni]